MRITRFARGLSCALVVATFASSGSPARAQRLQAEGVKELADQIVAGVTKEQKRKVAIVPFRELDGQATVFGTFLAEELTTRLFMAGSLDIVERSMLDKIMSELKLGASGAIDPTTAKQIGKLAGVDAIVTGSITDLPSSVAVNCRLIDVQTGRVFAAAQTRIVKDDDVKAMMGKSIAAPGGAPVPAPTPAPQAAVAQRVSVGDFLFELEGCSRGAAPIAVNRRPSASVVAAAATQTARPVFDQAPSQAGRPSTGSGSDVVCRFFITNRSDQNVDTTIIGTQAFDQSGNQYRFGRMRLANQSNDGYVASRLIPAVRTQGTMLIVNVATSSTQLSAIEMDINRRSVGGGSLTLRNVPISR